MISDLRFALRRLRRRPLHSALVVATLGIGLGASIAVFTVVDTILLRPLPLPDPERLVAVSQTIPAPGYPELDLPGITLQRIREKAGMLSGASAWMQRDVNLVGADATQRLVSAQVTEDFLTVLGAAPALGRDFTADEARPGGPRAVLLSDALWRSRFAANPRAVGSVANLEGEPFTIVGVMPASFTVPSRDVAIWEPLQLDPAIIDPGRNRLTVLARLREATSIDAAQRELTSIIQEVGREFPGPHPGSALDPSHYRANVRRLAEVAVGDARPVVLLLLGGVLMLLVLTCANVANLQLASLVVRGEELAVRAALGASRTRLVSGALLEGIVLTLAGAILGGAIAMSSAGIIVRLLPPSVGLHGSLFSDRAPLFAAIAVLAIGAVVGALPVSVVAGRDPAGRLRDRAAGASPPSAGRLRRVLATTQVALAVLLLHGAGLLIASANEVQRVSLGFRTDSTITLRLNMPDATMRDRTQRERLLRRIVREVEQLAGVSAVGLVNALPLELGRRDQAMAVEGRPFRADGSDPVADYRVVSHGYFGAMGIPLRKGRIFTDDDASATFTPLVISRGLERRLFPDGRDPIGVRLRFGPASPWMPIIGVVDDVKNRSVTEDARPEFYTPGLGTWSALSFRSELTIVVRADGDAMPLVTPIRRIVRETAPDIATYRVASLGDIVRESRARMLTATKLMSGYALVALLLAVAGTYALLAYLVNQRRQELAIRVALGAGSRAVVRLVAGESAMIVAIGAVVGLACAALTSRLLGSLLYGVSALDPLVIGAVVTCAGCIAVGAALVPARRATRVDPCDALRRGG